MGTTKIETTLDAHLDPGETVIASRGIGSNGRVEEAAFETTMALLGPAVYAGAAIGSVTADGAVPRSTNLLVVTDRRLLWCHKPRFAGEPEVLGADALATVHAVELIPARIALAKLRITFHDRSTVQFDLPSDHRAEEFAADVAHRIRPILTRAVAA